MKLTKTKQQEIETIAQIYMTEFSKPPYNEPWTIKKAIEKMQFYKKFYDLYTIKEKTVIGFIVINPNFMCPGEIAFGEEMAIKKEFQNQGIGTETFKQIFKIYKDKGYKSFLAIANPKSKAFSLYKKLNILPCKENVLIERKL